MAQEKKLKVSEENRKLIEAFEKVRSAQKKGAKTIRDDIFCLEKFAHFLGNKHFNDTTEKDLLEFFTNIKTKTTYNLLGMKLIVFYRWLLKLKRKERPQIMEWWSPYSKKKIKNSRDPNYLKKQFITPDEYQTILNNCWDKFGQWEAMFEAYYLSGARLNEVRNMKIKNVLIEDGRVSIEVPVSKTKTREIPLEEHPDRLVRWLHHHPDKNNPEAPLWISLGPRNTGEQISQDGIYSNFWKIRRTTDIKDTLTLHSFRKTRATIMVNDRNEDGFRRYTSKQLALFFGWELSNVNERMEEYDTSGNDELKKIVFEKQKNVEVESYDILKQKYQREKQENQKKIVDMEQDIRDLKQLVDQLMTATTGQPSTL